MKAKFGAVVRFDRGVCLVTPSCTLFLLLSCLLISQATAACTGYGMMDSGKTRITVEGPKVTFTPLKDSVIFADFFNLTLTINNITERNLPAPEPPATIPECNWSANAEVDAIQAWRLADFDCTIVQSFYIRPDDHIRVDYITINYTIASTPSLVITNTFYATNGSFEERPSTNTTFVDPGREYVWKYEYVPQKNSLIYATKVLWRSEEEEEGGEMASKIPFAGRPLKKERSSVMAVMALTH